MKDFSARSKGLPGLLPGQIRGQMMDRPLLALPLLRYAADFHGDTPLVTRSVEGPMHRTTYAATFVRVQQLANALVALGVKPGDRVATLAWNTWRHVELYFAIAGIGAVCHTINPRLSPEQICFIVNDAKDTLLFFDLTFAVAVDPIAAGAPSVRKFVALSDAAHVAQAGFNPAIGVLAYEDLIVAHPAQYDFPEFDENAAASLCYTSGTTGNPKGVLYSHRALVLHSYCLTTNFHFDMDEVALPVVPMFHVNAWAIPYAAPMTGARLVLPGRNLEGQALFDLMDAEGVTGAYGVPTVWIGVLEAMRKAGRKPHALTRVLTGGSAVPESMVMAFDSFGVTTHHAWGMTETTPIGVINTLKPRFKTAPATERMAARLKQGRALYGVDMRIVDDDGALLPHDGVASGRLQVRGPWVIESYFNGEATTLTADGWFDTGDIATIDADGYMLITDRRKDIIKSGGEWISSVLVENAVMGCPGIAQAAVIGIAHARWQERPLLICVASGAARPTIQEINAYLAPKMAKWWLPDAVTYVDALPLGATGKVQKSTLRERFKDFALDDAAAATG